MDWRTSFDCDSFLDKERNHHGYYWLDTVALTSFIENLLEQERKRVEDESIALSPPEYIREPMMVSAFNDGVRAVLSIINKK